MMTSTCSHGHEVELHVLGAGVGSLTVHRYYCPECVRLVARSPWRWLFMTVGGWLLERGSR